MKAIAARTWAGAWAREGWVRTAAPPGLEHGDHVVVIGPKARRRPRAVVARSSGPVLTGTSPDLAIGFSVTGVSLVTASHAGSGGRPRMISRCSVPASGSGRPGTTARGYPGPPAPDRVALLSQQAALRRPGCLRPSSEPGTRRARASGRGVLRPAVSRARPRSAADPDP